MAAPHVVVRGHQSSNRSKKSDNSIYFSNSSSNHDLNDEDDDDDDDDEIRHHGGEAYINLMHQRASSNHHNRDWLKRNRKILNFCHKFCFIFVILSGFLVLLTLVWLHFSLRAQTQDL